MFGAGTTNLLTLPLMLAMKSFHTVGLLFIGLVGISWCQDNTSPPLGVDMTLYETDDTFSFFLERESAISSSPFRDMHFILQTQTASIVAHPATAMIPLAMGSPSILKRLRAAPIATGDFTQLMLRC